MEKFYVVYSEFFDGHGEVQRYYYGSYTDHNKANEIALYLNEDVASYHYCVCEGNDAISMHINCLPGWINKKEK